MNRMHLPYARRRRRQQPKALRLSDSIARPPHRVGLRHARHCWSDAVCPVKIARTLIRPHRPYAARSPTCSRRVPQEHTPTRKAELQDAAGAQGRCRQACRRRWAAPPRLVACPTDKSRAHTLLPQPPPRARHRAIPRSAWSRPAPPRRQQGAEAGGGPPRWAQRGGPRHRRHQLCAQPARRRLCSGRRDCGHHLHRGCAPLAAPPPPLPLPLLRGCCCAA
jgi:hypothetical protein